jgi:hypothetical protein
MAAEHDDFIFLGGSGNFADDVEAHLVVLVDLGLDVEAEFGRHAVLDETGDAVVVLGCDGHHGRWSGIGWIL